MYKFVTTITFLPVIALMACGNNGVTAQTATVQTAENAAGTVQAQAWTERVGKTGAGYLMGNPDAAVKLVEYGAITCPGCAQFHRASQAGIMDLVKTGNVSFEFRPFLVHGIRDLPGFLLARCNGPDAFFKLSGQLFDEQAVWLGKLNGLTQPEQDAFSAAAPADKIAIVADKMDLVNFIKQRGVSETAARQCLADTAATRELIAQTEKASRSDSVAGTPTILVNGMAVDANWPAVEAAIEKAGAR